MKIRVGTMAFSGTPKEIAQQMHSTAFGQDGKGLREYIAWTIEQAQRVRGVVLLVDGETDEEVARSFVEEMLRTGLAEVIPPRNNTGN